MTDTATTLVERLRRAYMLSGGELYKESADEIERLTAERYSLSQRIEHTEELYRDMVEQRNKWKDAAIDAQAELSAKSAALIIAERVPARLSDPTCYYVFNTGSVVSSPAQARRSAEEWAKEKQASIWVRVSDYDAVRTELAQAESLIGRQAGAIAKLAKAEAALAEATKQGEPPKVKVAAAEWLIWSNEHHAWWASDRCGYRNEVMKAGRYTLDEAHSICRTRSWVNGAPPETMIHESSIPAMLAAAPQQQTEGKA